MNTIRGYDLLFSDTSEPGGHRSTALDILQRCARLPLPGRGGIHPGAHCGQLGDLEHDYKTAIGWRALRLVEPW